ncbi:MAG TPA: ABC transporter permease [bacterium]|nr:ABC transporter permease [bacterium]
MIELPTAPTPPPPEKGRSLGRLAWERFRRNPRGMTGLVFVLLMAAVAFFSPLLANRQPIVCRYQGQWYFPAMVEVIQNIPGATWIVQKSPPFSQVTFNAKRALTAADFALWPPIPFDPRETTVNTLQPPSREHWLGTDQNGRDIAARVIYGTIVSIQVGLVSMGIATGIGIFLGALAGYYQGWTDILISRLIEIVQCFPTFFLILSILAWLEPSIINVMIVIGLTSWTSIARYTRGEFLRLQNQEFVLATRALGCGSFRIMFIHILPNSIAPVLVTVTFGIASAILAEAGLSWLGFGVQQPDPSWGNILRDAYEYLRSAPHMVYPPCAAIFLAVLCYNLVGDALRDAIDPRIA